jgi:O-antigen/teichoic acid export membrane protein
VTRWQDKSLTQAELKHASVRGGVITFAAQLVKFILNTAVTVWLAHILVPEDFGLVAIVMVIINFFALFKDAGFSVATVQQETVTHEQVSLLFWMSAMIGIVLGLLLNLIAPSIALFFNESRLVEIVQVLSLVFFVGGLGIQHEALMRRQMRFRGLVVIEVSGLLLASITAIWLAISGAGYWAMVWMQVVAIVVRVVLLWLLTGWLPSLPVLKVGVRKMAMFGGQLTFANVIHYLSRQSDQVLLGWWSGAHALGLYATSMQMLLLPMRQILSPLTQVAVVTLSRVQADDSGFCRTYLLLVKIVAYATMPLMAVLSVLADPVVRLFLGEQWLEAVPIVAILACAGWVLPVSYTMGWVLTARGQGWRMLVWNMMMAPVTLLVFAISLPWGAVGMAVAFTLVIYGSRYFHFRYVLFGTPVSAGDLCRALIWPACLSLLLAVAAIVALRICSGFDVWVLLAVSLLAVLAVLAACVVWIAPMKKECLEIWQLLDVIRRKEIA